MKISYSKYKTFLDNPEKYRLYYVLGLTPEGDESPTLFNFGKRRGRCFHALSEGVDRAELVKTYGLDMVTRCEAMREVVPDIGLVDWIEQPFSFPLGDGKHTAIGYIDHRFCTEDGFVLGDYKTTKGTRTKAQTAEYFADLERSTQHHFYLRAARAFGFPTDLFTYHVIFDRKDKESKPRYVPLHLGVGPSAVDRTMDSVYAACEVIQFLREYGEEKPWPDTRKYGFGGEIYETIAGRTLPKGAVPQGFTTRWKEHIQAEDECAGKA